MEDENLAEKSGSKRDDLIPIYFIQAFQRLVAEGRTVKVQTAEISCSYDLNPLEIAAGISDGPDFIMHNGAVHKMIVQQMPEC